MTAVIGGRDKSSSRLENQGHIQVHDSSAQRQAFDPALRFAILAKDIANVGTVPALPLFLTLFAKFQAFLPHSSQTPANKGRDFVDILVISLTVLVIAVLEGLPLTVTLSLAFEAEAGQSFAGSNTKSALLHLARDAGHGCTGFRAAKELYLYYPYQVCVHIAGTSTMILIPLS